MLYLLTYLWCIPSPVFMFINAEAWVIGNVLLNQADPILIAVLAAAGQLTGYTILYVASERIVKALPKLDGKLQTFDSKRYERISYGALTVGSIVGIPPAVLLTLAGRALGYRYVPYILVLAFGRTTRFLVIAHAPGFFSRLFGIGN